jgi:hypothetical protein
MDLHRNPRYWEQPSPGRWLFKGWSTLAGPGADAAGAATANAGTAGAADPGFQATSVMDSRASPSYIVIGKGYP